MLRTILQRTRAAGAVFVLLVGASLAHGAGLTDFELLRAVPAEASIVAAGRDHAGLEFVNTQWERVWRALEQGRFDRDLKVFLKQVSVDQGGTSSEEFEQNWLEISDLLAGVHWQTLFKREFVVAARIGLPTEFVAVMRPPAEHVQGNYEGLVAIVKRLAADAPDLTVTETTDGPTTICQVAAAGPVPVSLTLARHRNALLIGIGGPMVEQSLALLRGDTRGALVTSQRFTQALNQLPPPADGLWYVDVDRLMQQVRGVAEQAMQMAQDSGAELTPAAAALPGKLIDWVDLFDYAAGVRSTDGKRTRYQSVVLLRDGAAEKPLYKALFGNPPLQDPLKYVPKTAMEVSIANGINWPATYDAVVEFVRTEVPEGASLVEGYDATMRELGFDLRADLFAWLDGSYVTFSIPGETVMRQGDWATIVRVRDGAAATQKLATALTWAQTLLADQDARVVPVQVAGEHELKTLDVPSLRLFGFAPALGVIGDNLYIASSAKVVELSLAAASGGETFATNARFQEEGLKLERNVVAMSFSDKTRVGETWSQMLKMAPMVEVFGGQAVSQNRPLVTLLRMGPRLGVVAAEFNFMLSNCSQTTFDGRKLTTIAVDNYREPPAPPVSAPATGGAATSDNVSE